MYCGTIYFGPSRILRKHGFRTVDFRRASAALPCNPTALKLQATALASKGRREVYHHARRDWHTACVGTAGLLEEDPEDKCIFIHPVTQAPCKFKCTPGKQYCGEHLYAATGVGRRRVPCPADPSHSIYEDEVASHLKKCPTTVKLRQEQALPFFRRGINAGDDPRDDPFGKGRAGERVGRAAALGHTGFMQLVDKVCKAHEVLRAGDWEVSVLRPSECEPYMQPSWLMLAGQKVHRPFSLKHALQQASIIGNMQQAGVLDGAPLVVEFGAGKGYLGMMLAEAAAVPQLLLVDNDSFRFRAERILRRMPGLQVERVRCDISDLDASLLPALRHGSRPWVAAGKHLCGACTDYALRCALGAARQDAARQDAAAAPPPHGPASIAPSQLRPAPAGTDLLATARVGSAKPLTGPQPPPTHAHGTAPIALGRGGGGGLTDAASRDNSSKHPTGPRAAAMPAHGTALAAAAGGRVGGAAGDTLSGPAAGPALEALSAATSNDTGAPPLQPVPAALRGGRGGVAGSVTADNLLSGPGAGPVVGVLSATSTNDMGAPPLETAPAAPRGCGGGAAGSVTADKALSGPAVGPGLEVMSAALSNDLAGLSMPGPGLRGVVVATCCHHRCSWGSYVGRELMEQAGFTPEEFELISWMTGWAVCGHDDPRIPTADEQSRRPADTTPPPQTLPSDAQDNKGGADAAGFNPTRALPRAEKIALGAKCKDLIDLGRARWLESQGMTVRLLLYAEPEVSGERRLILAVVPRAGGGTGAAARAA